MKNQPLQKFLFSEQRKKETGIVVSERSVKAQSPLHWHNFIELELITSGVGEQNLNGRQYNLKKGCLSVMRFTDFHQVTPIEGLNLLNLMVDDSVLNEEILSKLSNPSAIFCELDELEYIEFEYFFKLCKMENDRPNPDKRYLKQLIICIFLKLLKLTPHSSAQFHEEQPIQTALLYMHMHFRESPTLSEVAKIAHYNVSHFSSTFHKEMGTTYSDYLNSLKISYAKELLISTSLKISEVCYECGFSSHSNFLRLFKEKTGMSPIRFKKDMVDKA